MTMSKGPIQEAIEKVLTTDCTDPVAAWEIVTESGSTLTQDPDLARLWTLAGFEARALKYRGKPPAPVDEGESFFEGDSTLTSFSVFQQIDTLRIVNAQSFIKVDRASAKSLHDHLGRFIEAGVRQSKKRCKTCGQDEEFGPFCYCIPF